MAVYFKFKSAKDFDSVSIDGHFISVANLKDKIVEQKKLGRGSDYDLMISNAQTNEEYTDEGFMVPKNTSVIVRRVPGRPSMPIVADVRDERKSSLEAPPVNSGYQILESTQKNTLQSTGPDGLDDFGIDLYAVPELVQAPTLADDEDSKIKAFVDSSANEWQRQTQEGFAGAKAYGNKGQGRGLPLRGGYGRGGFEKKNPPHGYVCHRCGVTGHYIQHCPTNGDPTYDMKKVKPPTGIPKTMLVANPDGSYALPTGEVAVLKPNEAAFEREVDGLPSSSRPIFDIPPELCCPLCKGVLKEAVLTSKCCFNSYCDKCIRNEIISKAKCVCGAANVLADDLLPNRTLRDAISRFMDQASAATSSENVGSRAQLPDMESAPYARPAVSVSLKEASSVMVESDGSGNNEALAGGKDDVLNQGLASAKRGPKTQSVSGTRPGNNGETCHPVKQGEEVADASPESQLTKDTAQEMVSSERLLKPESDLRDEGLTLSEPVKGKKKTKGKRPRQVNMEYSEGMWNQGPNYNNSQMQAENCCMHCGSYEHPSWNCYMLNGPGPSHHPPPMHGPMFGPGFNPQMMGMMHPPMGDGYMMPYPGPHNPGPYNGYGVPPYEFQFNGPMGPPPEPFVPHAAMMPYGPPPPMQRNYGDPNLMSREEFEARKAELKRRREREQRFGREHVKYPSTELDIGSARLQGRVGPRLISPADRERETVEREVEVRSHGNGEQRGPLRRRMSKPREDWNEGEVQASSDAEGSPYRDYHMGKAHERWSSRHGDGESSGEEVSGDGRYSKESAHSKNQKGRGYTSRVNGHSGQDAVRLARKRSASGYDSEDDVDLRRQSGSQVGPSSPYRAFGNTVPDDQPSTDVEFNPKDISNARRQVGERSVKAVISRERPRGSVFDRTNLPIKPRRTIENEYDAVDDREFRAKRIKVAGSRPLDRDQVARDSEDSSRQRAGVVVSRKRRVKQDS